MEGPSAAAAGLFDMVARHPPQLILVVIGRLKPMSIKELHTGK
jgi:hypothetical protein